MTRTRLYARAAVFFSASAALSGAHALLRIVPGTAGWRWRVRRWHGALLARELFAVCRTRDAVIHHLPILQDVASDVNMDRAARTRAARIISEALERGSI